MKYCCEDCGREWDYPIGSCIFCDGAVSKVDIGRYTVEEITQACVPSEDHPIIPYYVMLLKDVDDSYKFQKTFQHHNIGDVIHTKGEQKRVCTIGVIGTGVTGRGIAEVAIRTGNKVILKSRSNAALENALAAISKNLRKSMSPEEAQAMLNNIITTTDYEPFARSDFVIESVVEDLQIKRDIFKILDSICDPKVVLASNTSSLRISQIAEEHPTRIAGLHFFNPITRMQLVEVVKGEKTSVEVLNKCVEIAKMLNKVPILVKDTPGFVVNRLLFAMINEACHLLEEETSQIEDIDKAMKLGANYPMGPFELADLIGLDLCLEIIENLHEASGGRQFDPSKLLRNLVKKGHYGKKTGQGFYNY
ncbi:MAG: 3-hydroxyacyl-CoA dehydrogenase family protein [Methanotrichaceae archaeon]